MENLAWVDKVWEKLDRKLAKSAVSARYKLPAASIDGVYDDKSETDPLCWTNGFWPGIMWLMYGATKNEVYKITAQTGEKLMDKAFESVAELHHDVGFMWNLSAGADYKLTKSRQAMNRNLLAANILAGRFNINGGYIRAWNHEWCGMDTHGFAIIDCLMNLPLLYWATEVTGDERYYNIAVQHADKTLQCHVRPDGSVNHIVKYNPDTGEVVELIGGQGYDSQSSWSRGQAWGIYGYTLSYLHTKEVRYLDAAKRIANYFIAASCDDYLPKCDFRSPAQPVIYDSSAGLIAACGLIELSKAVSAYEAEMYFRAAVRYVKAVVERFADLTDDRQELVTGVTMMYHAKDGRHVPFIYADYFFVEAISRLKGFDTFLW